MIGRTSMSSTNIEKTNLEAHVELCAERYAVLEEKLDNLDKRMDTVEQNVVAIRESINTKTGGINKTMLTASITVIGVMFSAIITLLIHLINK